jgi:hypothetical protein
MAHFNPSLSLKKKTRHRVDDPEWEIKSQPDGLQMASQTSKVQESKKRK